MNKFIALIMSKGYTEKEACQVFYDMLSALEDGDSFEIVLDREGLSEQHMGAFENAVFDYYTEGE